MRIISRLIEETLSMLFNLGFEVAAAENETKQRRSEQRLA